MVYTGGCLCGGVRYEVDEMSARMAHCHCSMCRKFHGAAFATFGSANRQSFRWLRGEELLKTYVADNGTRRRFCSTCGSSMTFSSSEGSRGVIEIALGTLDHGAGLQPDAHIYTGSKAEWFEVTDGLVQFVDGRKEEAG